METQFNPLLVTVSILVAIFASYVALNLAYNGTLASGRKQVWWLSAGALAMGMGIWSMHFVGMLAFEMPGMAMAYDVPLMVVSVVVAIGASALAFYITSRSEVTTKSIVFGGAAMAVAIAGMHYIGMYSMRMEAVIEWNYFLVFISIVIALVASWGALWMLIRMRHQAAHFSEIIIASIVMGFAVSGMHYTGMYAAKFHHSDTDGIQSSNLLVSSGLAVTVIATTLLILFVGLISSVLQKMWVRESEGVKESLGKSEEKFRHLVNAVKDYAIFMLDLEGHITTWNSGAERITGYTEEEVLGKHISMFFVREDLGKRTAEVEMAVAKGSGHFEAEAQQTRKDGSRYWASIVLTPLYDADGNISGYSKVVRDITAVKENERRLRQLNEELEIRVRARTEALAHREKQLRTITNASPILIAEVDINERFLFANEAFCKYFQYPGGDIIGKTLANVVGLQRREEAESLINRVFSGEQVNYERRARNEGVISYLASTLIPEFSENGKVIGFIYIGTDVTKYKEIQAELEKSKVAAESANATKSAFLANMSHEIRTPLGAILGFSELLASNEMSPSERVNSAEVIKRNGRLLSNIINDILDLSKVEAGKLQVEKMDVPFSDVMKEIGSVLSLEAAEKGIELKVTSEGAIPEQIKTDPLRLRQIIFNIVGNAIKFTSHGSVVVNVTLLPSGKNTKLAFIVKDTGEGIKPEQALNLFTPFTQADVSTTRRFGGTGLGLVLSKKLANALGGDVVLTESTPGQGSTFTITIDPGLNQKILFASSAAKKETIEFPLQPGRTDLNSLKVLVVDDSMDNLALIRKVLVLAGARVDIASNGKEGIEKALHGNFDLILMDLQMPEMDGYEANRRLREAGYKKPIIALTAHAMKEEKLRTLRNGFDDHLTKPIDQGALIKTLATYAI